MNQYLLSTYAVDGQVPGSPITPEEWQMFMERVSAVEAEMDVSGTFVLSGGLRLHGDNVETTVRVNDSQVVITEGAFAQSEAQIAGFYIINAGDFDSALKWAGKVAQATNHPIEVRPFHAIGRLKA